MLKENLKMLRNEKELSIKQLSLRSGIARGYLSEIESGKYKNPSLDVICKLCKALEVSPNELIPEEYWK